MSFLRIRLRSPATRNQYDEIPGTTDHQVHVPPRAANRLKRKTKTQRRLEKMKEDPGAYEQHLNQDALRSKFYRTTVTDEQKTKSNEAAKLRMIEYRKRLKEKCVEKEASDVTSRKPLTRSEGEKKALQREKHLKQDALCSKIYRSILIDEHKIKSNEAAELRMIKYRKCIEKEASDVTSKKPLIRSEEEKKALQREKWKLAKRTQRKEQTAQKRHGINEKRRMKYHKDQELEKVTVPIPDQTRQQSLRHPA